MKGGCGCDSKTPIGGFLTTTAGGGKRKRGKRRSRRTMKMGKGKSRKIIKRRNTRLMRGGLSFSLLGDQATNVANYTSILMGNSTGVNTLPGVTSGLASNLYIV